MDLKGWPIVLAVLAASLGFAQTERLEIREPWAKVAPTGDNRVFEQILEYRKKGDFERAAAVAIEQVNGEQPDDFLLQATAMTYFQRAQADRINKKKWVDLAIEYSERAFQANPSDLVNLFNVADGYMTAGMNLGKPEGCTYYEKSAEACERLESDPAIQVPGGRSKGNE